MDCISKRAREHFSLKVYVNEIVFMQWISSEFKEKWYLLFCIWIKTHITAFFIQLLLWILAKEFCLSFFIIVSSVIFWNAILYPPNPICMSFEKLLKIQLKLITSVIIIIIRLYLYRIWSSEQSFVIKNDSIIINAVWMRYLAKAM